MRLFWALPLLSASLCAAPKDLAPFFGQRSGSALLWDLETNSLAGVWNESRTQATPFRPGSLLKPFTFAALLENGLYSPSTKIPCQEGALSGEEALAYSCNEYFDDAAKRLGPEDLTRGYARFGLDSSSPTIKLATFLPVWRRLVARHREARLAPLFAGLRKAVEFGTAHLASHPRVPVAGKTGTMRGTASFAGFAPFDKPRYLLLIHLDSGSGGGDAAPFAGQIFSSLFAQPLKPFDPSRVRVRLFWQSPPTQLNLPPGSYPAGTEIIAASSRLLAPGPLEVRQENGRYLIDSDVALEAYLAAVLHGEAAGFRHPASRQAMAVAARTYAAHFRGRHAEEGFDFCDTTHCQDARFVLNPRADLIEAVESTAGELLWHQGKAAAAYYHADSGGQLETSPDAPFLKQRPDPWWRDEGNALWTWRIRAADLASALRLTLVTPQFRIVSREPSGRARGLDVFGHPAEAAAFRTAVGRALGWEKLPSRLFEVQRLERDLVFTGRGRGHGLGLPQTSAERMAAAGRDYRAILAEYYPGTALGLNPRGLTWQLRKHGKLRLYTTNPAQDARLLPLAAAELAKLETDLKLHAEPVLRIYPSRAAFRDSTGLTAPLAGATRGRHIQLPPQPSLSTLRHEILHALLETNTTQRHPLWFREGLVQAWLGESSADSLRVQALFRRYGRDRVLSFWRSGLPPGEIQQ